MLRSNLRHTLRHAQRQPVYTAINVLGLALGLACALLILLYVADERSFDQMHTNADRTYRLDMLVGGDAEDRGSLIWAMADAVAERVPAIETMTRLQQDDQPLMARLGSQAQFYEDHVLRADSNFLTIFDAIKVLEGSAARLNEPNTALLSRSAAARYFPDASPIGESLVRYRKWNAGETVYEVIGVIEDMPRNMHFRGDILLSMATDAPSGRRAWSSIAYTYVTLAEGAAPDVLTVPREAIQPLIDQHFVPGTTFAPMALPRIHLYGQTESRALSPPGDIRYVYLFSAIALLILLIACINYTNLATARAAQRAKEVGVRKSVGAARKQLIGQFLGESVLLALVAVVGAVALVQMTLPAFNTLMARSLTLDLASPLLWLGMLVTAGVVGMLAGAYPALVLSRFRPAIVLKGQVRVRSLPALRKSLIVFQFAVSVMLIICTLVIHDQLHFVQHERLGFAHDQVVVLNTRNALPAASAAAFQQELATHPGIASVGRGSGIPSRATAISFFNEGAIEGVEGRPPPLVDIQVDPQFEDALGLEIAMGRGFDADRPGDLETGVVVNEAAVRALGWTEPLGKTMEWHGETWEVIGVVRDFHMEDKRSEIEPLMMKANADTRRFYPVRFNTADIPALLTHLESTWEAFMPEKPFDYAFMDETFAAMYRAEQRLGQLFIVFAMLAVCIACLGLFGLTAYIVQQRTKEIGIRKVLGASATDLMGLLSRDFVVLVLIAFVIAGPLAYAAMQRWLSAFAYRTELGAGVFVIALGIALGIAMLTVGIRLIRAVHANPVESLRTS